MSFVPADFDVDRADLERHARDFAERSGFAYTVLERADYAPRSNR
jgi:hypothetical protein